MLLRSLFMASTVAGLLIAPAAVHAAQRANPSSYQPLPEALDALVSTADVNVRQVSYTYIFSPAAQRPSKGLILYPGGLVDFRSYAPVARAIAARGYLVALVEMPLDVAFLGYTRADAVIDAFPNVKTWAIGGHSLGGVAACTYAKECAGRLRGVVLWASYPSATDNLKRSRLRVLSVYGTLDGLTDASDIAKSRTFLPRFTQFVPIEGGNHTQCGSYWDGLSQDFLQPGDNPATISRSAQQDAIADATADFLDGL